MKKLYLLLLMFFSLLYQSQPYSTLLKNADWTIVKIQWNGVDYLPPPPFSTSGKVRFLTDNGNGFQSQLFNTAFGSVTFGANNATYFTLQGIAVTLAEYHGENEAAVQQFDAMTTGFYADFQPTQPFNFEYEEAFSAKKLTVTNPLGDKIFYSNLILANEETFGRHNISVYPNPASDHFFIEGNPAVRGTVRVQIVDASGKLILDRQKEGSEAVDISPLLNGVYILKIEGGGILYSTKLVVQH